MNKDDINDLFINPTSKIGYGLYAIRQSLKKAVDDLKDNISGDVADLGCGIMPYKKYLLSNGKINRYTGIDLQHSEYHNQIKPDLYWDGFIIPFEDNSLDWVIVTEFLEHYFDTSHILMEIKRVLKAGGKAFFTVPFIYMLHEVPFDYHRFTPFSLQNHFTNANYKKVDIYALGGFNHSLVIMISLWNKKSGEKGITRLFLKFFLFLFHKRLLNRDNYLASGKKDFELFSNNNMPSGLWGYAQK